MKIVPVAYHHEPDGWWADSPEIPGWSATAESVDELRQLVEDGIRFALEDANVTIYHMLEELQVSGLTFDFVRGEATVRARPGSVKDVTDLHLVAQH
jgi:predicted RNase H-like HicB family nuclease